MTRLWIQKLLDRRTRLLEEFFEESFNYTDENLQDEDRAESFARMMELRDEAAQITYLIEEDLGFGSGEYAELREKYPEVFDRTHA